MAHSPIIYIIEFMVIIATLAILTYTTNTLNVMVAYLYQLLNVPAPAHPIGSGFTLAFEILAVALIAIFVFYLLESIIGEEEE